MSSEKSKIQSAIEFLERNRDFGGCRIFLPDATIGDLLSSQKSGVLMNERLAILVDFLKSADYSPEFITKLKVGIACQLARACLAKQQEKEKSVIIDGKPLHRNEEYILTLLSRLTYAPTIREIVKLFDELKPKTNISLCEKTVAKYLKSLEKKGLVERPDGPNGGVTISEKGRRIFKDKSSFIKGLLGTRLDKEDISKKR